MLYRSTTRAETAEATAENLTDAAVRTWIDRHPDLPVKYHNGVEWHASESAADRYAWYALIEATGDGTLRISGAGPRHGSRRHTVIGEPQPLSGRLATFGEGVVFNQLLDDAVRGALNEVERAHRAVTRSHRKPQRGRRD